MAYCRNCGSEIDDKAVICPKCGVPQTTVSNYNSNSSINDNGGLGWGILGFFIPIVGLILFLVWKDTKPKTSKAAGIGALVSVIFWPALYVFIVIISILIALL